MTSSACAKRSTSSGADVEQVVQLAEKLLRQRCKDLRVATYYMWARLHADGEAGLADGLSLLAALVERYAGEGAAGAVQ